MCRLMFFLALAVFAFTTSACSGGGNYDAYQALGARIEHRAAINNTTVTRSLALQCPSGMKAVSDTADVQSGANISYHESHGSNGRGSRSQYGTYSGARVYVEAEAGAQGRRQVTCVIDLTRAG